MNNPALPQYPDDEVKIFHPFFGECLKNVLLSVGLEDELEVVHHWTAKGFPGIIDFAICNKTSKKVLLPIEIKKTKEDLKSMGRQQARGYSESLGLFRGSDFYLATNLEHVELFKTAPDRVLTQAQLLRLSNSYVGNLANSPYSEFSQNLEIALVEVMNVVRANDGTDFASNISGLLHALESTIEDLDSWHQAQTFYAFDYIRGALKTDRHFRSEVDEWKAAFSFIETPLSMKDLVSKIDFDLIFDKSPLGKFNASEIAQISAGAFESGQENDFGQDLSQVVNEIAHSIKKIPGVVETSQKLAELLVAHSFLSFDSQRNSRSLILEPGCGSGNLLVAIKKLDRNISANQIFAFEKEEIFREVLALRIGLHYTDSLRVGHRPNLSIRTLESVKIEECENVGLTILNPPFIRGVDCVNERKELAALVQGITGSNSTLTGEQLGYECGYLELLVSLLPVNSVIAAVFPKNALLRPGSAQLRSYLLNEFGLCQVVLYENDNVFGNVQKSTILLVGCVGIKKDKIDIYNYKIEIEDLDLGSLPDSIARKEYIRSNSQLTEVDRSTLENALTVGWKSILGVDQYEYDSCIRELYASADFVQLQSRYDLIRGTAGNSGGSDLLFNPRKSSSESKLHPPDKWSAVPSDWIIPAAKNSDFAVRQVSQSTGESGICLPGKPLLLGSIESAIDSYCSHIAGGKDVADKGVQRKKEKSPSDLQRIVVASKAVSGPTVLIPRAQRTTAQILFSFEENVLISTNFFHAICDTADDAVVLASWLFSVFGQMQLERTGIDQEGMRKLEKTQIGECLIPIGLDFSIEEMELLKSELLVSDPLTFNSIRARKIDEIWAQKICPGNWKNLMENVTDCLRNLANERLSN